jgi:hypothetical protein
MLAASGHPWDARRRRDDAPSPWSLDDFASRQGRQARYDRSARGHVWLTKQAAIYLEIFGRSQQNMQTPHLAVDKADRSERGGLCPWFIMRADAGLEGRKEMMSEAMVLRP